MKIYLRIDNDIITDVKFNTFGCGSAIKDYYDKHGIVYTPEFFENRH